MKRTLSLASGTALFLCSAAGAANIYLISSGDAATDNAAAAALSSFGHTVTIGVTYDLFDGAVNLAPFQTVYLQCNANWTIGTPMPGAGAQQLIDWVNAGGRLVTSEWVVYYSGPLYQFGLLDPILPAEQTFSYASMTFTTYESVTPDPAINAGLPASISFPLTSYTGTETLAMAKGGATTYYTTATSNASIPPHSRVGLAGWAVGAGLVYSFTSTCGPDQVGDPLFARLFSNVMGPTTGGCYANCDQSTQPPILNVADFGCFLGRFAAGDPYANCDGSTQEPILNVADFGCFLGKFAAGCR